MFNLSPSIAKKPDAASIDSDTAQVVYGIPIFFSIVSAEQFLICRSHGRGGSLSSMSFSELDDTLPKVRCYTNGAARMNGRTAIHSLHYDLRSFIELKILTRELLHL